MVFKCCHNIRNQPVSTAGPSPSSFHDITTIGTHHHLGEILKDVFSYVFSRQYCIWIKQHRQILFFPLPDWFLFVLTRTSLYIQLQQVFLFIINLRILSFSQVRFSLCPIQILKHFSLPQHLPTPTTNNITILLPIPTGKEPAYLECLIGSILNILFQQIYPAHYRPTISESAVQSWMRA